MAKPKLFQKIELNATNISQLESNKANINHQDSTNVFGVGSAQMYGHLKLSDSTTDSTSGVSSAVASTPLAVSRAITSSNNYTQTAINNLIDNAPSNLNTLNKLATVLGTLTSTVDGKANDSAVVHVSGDETIAGKKSFTTPIEGNLTGNATSADKLNTNAGSEIIPVYFNAGVPVATSYSIQSNVPENAVFTDNKVTQTSTTADGNYPVIIKYVANDTNSTEGVRYTSNVTINPSTGTITATNFSGNISGTADRATSDSLGNNIAETYATKTELSNIGDSLADVATTGSYNDLIDKPSSLKNPTSLTIQNSAGTSLGTYDGSTATTIKLSSDTVGLGNVTNESKATMFTNAALTGTPTAPTAANTTNSTQIATTAFVQSVIDSKIAASDAMIFKGTIGTGGTVTALPNTHSTGWTYKVITAGTYAGISCNVGDMIVCLTDGTSANNAHWTVIEGNIDGAVTGPASSVTNNVAVFDGTTGKIIKDSGFTIASSVPADAKFTDTTYSQANSSSLGLVKLTDTLSSSGVSTGLAATPQLVNTALGNYYTKTQVDEFVEELRVDDVSGAEYIVELSSGYDANNVYNLGTFTYPRGMNAVRVSLDGFILSNGIHYEEVISDNTSIYSNQIKLMIDTEEGMVLHIWVAPVALQVSALEDKVLAAKEYAELAQEVGDRLGDIDASTSPFEGSTSTSVGTAGLVPAPAAGNSDRFLNCDGSWKEITSMRGATSTVNGSAGLVPAPIAGQQELFLRGDGTWASVGVEGLDNFLPKSGGTMEGNLITKGSFGLVSSLSGTAINLSEASTFTKTITTNTTFSITGVPASTSAVFTLVITNGGNYVVSWPTNMKWASGEVPTLTSNGVDILTFITVDGGTTWFGTPSILDASS